MTGRSVGGGEDITHTVVGVGVGLTATGLAEQLVRGVVRIGIGVGGTVFRIGRDVPKLVVLIAIGIESIPGTDLILVRTDLPDSLCIDKVSSTPAPLDAGVELRIAYLISTPSYFAGSILKRSK